MYKPAKELRVNADENCLDCHGFQIRDFGDVTPDYVDNYIEDVNRRNDEGITLLHMAASYARHENVVAKAIEKGAYVNARSKHGYTPLHMATNYSSNSKTVKLLIDNGAYVNAIDDDGNTPLHFAIIRNSQELVKFLLKNGADVSMKNEDGKTAMELGEKNDDFYLSDAYWLLHDATYNQKDSPKNE